MRLRNIPGAMEMVMKSEYAISEPEKLKGFWKKEFANKNPIYIEIGMGKGRFIIDNAKSYPNINFIGIEKYPSVQIKAVQKLQGEEKLPNLRLLCINAELIENKVSQKERLIRLNNSARRQMNILKENKNIKELEILQEQVNSDKKMIQE